MLRLLGAAITLFLHGFYLCLRLTGRNGSFPRQLTASEERDCLQKMANGDAQAREKLILHNLRLVPHVIKKYYTHSSEQDDLISIGTIGLLKAVDTYNPTKNVKLPTYACTCIQNEILMHFRRMKRPSNDVSLYDSIDAGDDGSSLSILDVLQTDDQTQERLEMNETYAALLELVENSLDNRQKKLIKMRYGLGGELPRTQRDVAKELNISRSYVSRIEKKALETLESGLRKKDD